MKVAFIISYAVTIILAIGFIYCVYMKNYWIFKFVDKIKSPVQQLVYVLLMFVSSYVYVYLRLFWHLDVQTWMFLTREIF